jgi:anaerobic magnesium-protoporphyrin IX monomethyl ester cyclase
VRIQLVCPPATLQPPHTPPRHAPHHAAIVAAALRNAGHVVDLADQHLHTADLVQVVADARAFAPDLLLFVHSDYNRKLHADVLLAVSDALGAGIDAPLWGVARLDRAHAEGAMEALPALEGFLFGEPEFGAVLLAASLDDPTGIPGSIRRSDGLQVVDPGPVDFDASPTPAWDLVDMEHYGFLPHQSPHGLVYPVLASRGCPFPCFYCEVRLRPNWIARSVDAVIAEINEITSLYDVGTIFMADPTFGVKRDWTLEFCRRLQAEGPKGLRWSCMSRTDRVDAEMLQAMADAGCFSVLFGVESLNPVALDAAQKAMDVTTVGPAVRAAKDAGLEVIVSLMIGLPGDTPAGVERSLDQLIAMEPDFAQFFIVQLGEADAPEGGRLASDWEGGKHEFWGHVYLPDAFSDRAQLEGLKRRAFRKFYLRPAYLKGRVKALATSPQRRTHVARLAKGGLIAVKMAAGRATS